MNDSAAAVDEAAMDPSMADATMDVAMMEDVPEAPAASSIVFCPDGCEAKMGVKRVDNNMETNPDADNLKTVVEYEVKFGSSGVTDRGLLFGASISIDEAGKGEDDANGVNQASAYIGASDGSWKLTFGSNDPGIDLVGNIGLADADAISGDTDTIVPFTYTVGTVMRPIKLPGKSGALDVTDIDDYDNIFIGDSLIPSSLTVKQINDELAGYFTGTPTESSATEESAIAGGMPISVYSSADLPKRTDVRLDGKFGSFTFALTSGESGDNAWSLGTKFDAGAISVRLGIDSNDVLAAGVEGKFAGNTISGTYVRQSGEDLNRFVPGGTDGAHTVYARATSANAWTAMGVKFKRDLSEGTNIVLAYSKKDDKRKGYDIAEDSNKIELDFNYGLGGGATFYAGIERLSEDSGVQRTGGNFDDMVKKTTKTTTLETGITMKF